MRRTELRPNPEKVRDWVDRSRQRARDRQAERVDGHLPRPALKKTARRRKVAIPKPVRERALRRSGGLCICGCGRRATQVHHVLDETKFPELALVEDNMVAVFHDCNQRHHFQPGGRLRREVLPACAVRLAESQPRYEAHLERTYPVSEMAA